LPVVLPPTGGFLGVDSEQSIILLALGIIAAIAAGVSLVTWASEDPRRR
jgi:hypothetical protein